MDNLAIISQHFPCLQSQFTKLLHFNTWACMELSIFKCALVGTPHKTTLKPNTFKTKPQHFNLIYKGQTFPTLSQSEAYTYMGIQLVPSLSGINKHALPINITQSTGVQVLIWFWLMFHHKLGNLYLIKRRWRTRKSNHKTYAYLKPHLD